MKRTIFDEEHPMFRDTVRRLVENEIAPYQCRWERERIVHRDVCDRKSVW